MEKKINKRTYRFILYIIAGAMVVVAALVISAKTGIAAKGNDMAEKSSTLKNDNDSSSEIAGTMSIKEANGMPVYGNWRTFTTKDGLPSDKVYTVRIDGNRVLAGTHDGLAVYENGKWKTYTTSDGLGHNAVVSIDVNKLTGEVWLGTFGGLTRWSGGKFETYTQFNSGMPNDLVYNVICDGKDIWVATAGGAGHYDTFRKEWEIFTEQNAPMHEPWTYAMSAGDGKIFIAAWGGGVIEYNKETKQFRDYTDPDGFMEIDLQPDDGVVHDITTATSWADGVLWVSTYFGMSSYDGKNWKGFFDHDSGLASNFINFLRAKGRVAFVCSDKGLSTTDGTTWVTYKKNEGNSNGMAIITSGKDRKEVPLSPSISHNFIIGVDADKDQLWVATSQGVCRGELMK
ncbi:MAG TPA: hypothetical protein VK207_00140 [Bacteroidales bacterium]|nr:hypothetical protein [Bacteroidales bacterium]